MPQWRDTLPGRVTLLGCSFDPWTMDQCVYATQQYLDKGEFAHIVGVNADKLLQLRNSPTIASIVDDSEIIHPDGVSTVLAAKFLGIRMSERVAGIDLMVRLCAMAEKRNKSIYLLGAKDGVVRKTCQKLLDEFPNLRIAGYRDGYFSTKDEDQVIDQVINTHPDIVFVGITSPKKELLIEKFRSTGAKSVFLGVGGSFDVISGNIPRAPLIIQKMGMEWFFRLIQEPRRLAKRYLLGNLKFLWLVLNEKIKK